MGKILTLDHFVVSSLFEHVLDHGRLEATGVLGIPALLQVGKFGGTTSRTTDLVTVFKELFDDVRSDEACMRRA